MGTVIPERALFTAVMLALFILVGVVAWLISGLRGRGWFVFNNIASMVIFTFSALLIALFTLAFVADYIVKLIL
jgi:hypothetical protein